MRTLLLVLSLSLAMPLGLPVAAADETHADCEEGQWWILYRTTRAAQLAVENATRGSGASAAACEGEQWDGQDSVSDAQTSCSLFLDGEAPHASYCLGADPNTARGDDATTPAGARASADGTELYVAANAAFLARGAAYVGTCGAGEEGLEGETECRGSRELRHGLYVRDNTPSNVLATLTCIRLTGCYTPETDCSHAVYTEQAMAGGERRCDRDNTALGAMLVLA